MSINRALLINETDDEKTPLSSTFYAIELMRQSITDLQLVKINDYDELNPLDHFEVQTVDSMGYLISFLPLKDMLNFSYTSKRNYQIVFESDAYENAVRHVKIQYLSSQLDMLDRKYRFEINGCVLDNEDPSFSSCGRNILHLTTGFYGAGFLSCFTLSLKSASSCAGITCCSVLATCSSIVTLASCGMGLFGCAKNTLGILKECDRDQIYDRIRTLEQESITRQGKRI